MTAAISGGEDLTAEFLTRALAGHLGGVAVATVRAEPAYDIEIVPQRRQVDLHTGRVLHGCLNRAARA